MLVVVTQCLHACPPFGKAEPVLPQYAQCVLPSLPSTLPPLPCPTLPPFRACTVPLCITITPCCPTVCCCCCNYSFPLLLPPPRETLGGGQQGAGSPFAPPPNVPPIGELPIYPPGCMLLIRKGYDLCMALRASTPFILSDSVFSFNW